jgi:hypothetical protein
MVQDMKIYQFNNILGLIPSFLFPSYGNEHMMFNSLSSSVSISIFDFII